MAGCVSIWKNSVSHASETCLMSSHRVHHWHALCSLPLLLLVCCLCCDFRVRLCSFGSWGARINLKNLTQPVALLHTHTHTHTHTLSLSLLQSRQDVRQSVDKQSQKLEQLKKASSSSSFDAVSAVLLLLMAACFALLAVLASYTYCRSYPTRTQRPLPLHEYCEQIASWGVNEQVERLLEWTLPFGERVEPHMLAAYARVKEQWPVVKGAVLHAYAVVRPYLQGWSWWCWCWCWCWW